MAVDTSALPEQRSLTAADNPSANPEPVRRKVVAVSGASPDGRHDRLLDSLSQLYPVDFHRLSTNENVPSDGFIALDGDVSAGCKAAEGGIASYVVVEGRGDPVHVSKAEVRLGNSPLLDERLRNRALQDEEFAAFCPLAPLAGDEVLASRGGHPIWLNRLAGRAGCQFVALAPPVVRENEYLVEYFHGLRFLQLLPLMNFLRQLTRDVDWQAPAQHACLVLDDPSLYWPTYGFVNFRLLAEHAKRHNYSVAVATIPLDSWWVNPRVAEVFRSEAPRLSLIVHGNNHTRQEMLRPESVKSGLGAAAQALRRLDRLDKKHGLSVARIMEPPHGTVTGDLFPQLLSLGYEGVLATFELLVRMNRHSTWPATIGLESASMLAGGFPVIPRIRAYPSWKNDIMLAAFLRQPIAVTVHHQDAARGMEGLTEIAQVVNSIGNVVWPDIPGILQRSYRQKRSGEVLHVRMLSRGITVNVPAGVRVICAHRPWIAEGQTETIVIRPVGGLPFEAEAGAVSQPALVGEAGVVEVHSERDAPLHFSSVAQPGFFLWPIARKLMMEVRDRLTPALSRVGLGQNSIRTPAR